MKTKLSLFVFSVLTILTPEQFASWGEDNSVVNQYVADAIGVVIIS